LLVVLFLQRECKRTVIVPEIKTDTITRVHIDTINIIKQNYVPKITYRDTGRIQLIDVDTLQILTDYFAINFYRDTIISDSNAFIVVFDSIYQNSIKSRHIEAKVYKTTIYETITKTELEKRINKIFVGFGVGKNVNRFGLNTGLLLATKKENIYGVQYDPFNKDITFSIYWKLRIKK